MKRKQRKMTLRNRILFFMSAFCAALVLQICIGQFQSRLVLKPMEERTRSIQAISQFLNDVEGCMVALENYRWDYGDVQELTDTIGQLRQASDKHIQQISTDIAMVGEEQHLLANAAKTTYHTFTSALDSILNLLHAGRADEASQIYYTRAEPCGGYMRQYTQQLLEQAIYDSQSAFDELNALNDRLNDVQTVAVALCFLLGAVAVTSLVRLLSAVMEMAEASQSISRGDFDIPDVNESMEGEIGHMAVAFNEMKHSMKRQVLLLEKNNEMERQLHKKETETLELQALMEREKMQQLRTQINPHFLFNTLNVVLYTAQQEGAGETRSLLSALSQLFRYSLASNDEMVPLSREIHIVNEFFKISRARFGERMTLRYDADPELDLTETLVPSFLLQPIVENSLRHGLAPKEEGGQVCVGLKRQKDILYITVTDNGVGIGPEKLAELRGGLKDPPKTGEHIGICNVAARIRLLGENYGMDIQSREGEGTTVTLRVPYIMQTEEEETEYGEDPDRG